MTPSGTLQRPKSREAKLPWHVCNRARLKRDKKFDGIFFVAVTTTRIFCRPICPSRHSRDDHVSFYFDVNIAIADGYRACKRCRPEARPGSPAWLGTLATVKRGKRYIESGFLDHHSVEDLARRLGVGPRHLARLFAQHDLRSPAKLAQQRRIHVAIRLIKANTMTITQVAYASGFASLRRFNSAMKEHTGHSPTQFRNDHQKG